MYRLTFLLLCIPVLISAQDGPRNLLSTDLTVEKVAADLLPIDNWHYFPPTSDRAAWEGLPAAVKESIISRGDEALSFEWPNLPASVYLEFARNGNRSNYQAIYFERRSRLADLVAAEALTLSGKYLDQVIDGLWAVTEESSWCIPAHLYLQANGHTPLPDQQGEVVDLFAAETGTLVAWTHYLLHDQFDAVTPAINARIKSEMDRRILEPIRNRIDFWWMGLGERKNVNNWNPWVISNWLTAALLLERDPQYRAQHVHKAMVCLDNFINQQPEDGGCDEGPGYWGRAGASLFDCLDILHSASAGRINIFDEPLIRKTGTYITKAYIKQPYYLNFADASAMTKPDPITVFRYGQAVKDQDMMSFAAFLNQENGVNFGGSYAFGRTLNSIFHYQDVLDATPAEPLPANAWFPDLEVYIARDQDNTADGFLLAGKGGHNAESHNHNDVGNYIIFYNGRPAIIDVGVEEYRKETFSSDRYSIWTMQSQYHTLPTINGQMQKNGRNYAARSVQYDADGKSMRFSLDIAGAYPQEAGVKTWLREIDFQRGKAIDITESYELDRVSGETSLFFVTPCQPQTSKAGVLQLRDASGAFTMALEYDPKQFEASSESITIEDRRLLSVWGDTLYRVQLKLKNPREKGVLEYGFRVE
ncbi:heparinase II/III family protein [Flavilitoribacter nigricans]|uniref:Heparinase n=1 Tax=Flavilitoribacter nigricans (strain ATCC 23147 / DSM 23189 / NBRC 102662 / NCIMB 1420 / SS-2) TaxID=1122177 RepID=A0A2D0NIM3_FLAN2|nr:heparinase II/III family protein [Flavilitoribacter nigricans]PHN08240.1 heparinase [Flavilitoribacter nigricans DSM 23189 = NBRC 102662]